MPLFEKEHLLHRLFIVIVLARGIYGAFELIVGTALLFTSSVAQLAHTVVQGELIEDPSDIVALSIDHTASALLTHKLTFVSVYLITYGIVKVAFTIALLRKKLWAYSFALSLFTIFLVYQFDRVWQTHSVVLAVVTATDLLAILLTAHEYYHARKRAGIQ
jgi:uncharacterized membrane protein